MIRIAEFDILIFVKSSCFFLFFLRSYFGFMIHVTSPLILNLFLIEFLNLWPKLRVLQVNPVDLVFSIFFLSFNFII